MRKEAGGGRKGKKGEWKRPTTNERRGREGLHHHSVGPSLLSGVSFSSPPSLSLFLTHSEGPPPTQRGGRYNPRKGGGGKCCRWDRGRSMLGYYRESSSPLLHHLLLLLLLLAPTETVPHERIFLVAKASVEQGTKGMTRRGGFFPPALPSPQGA